MNNNRQEKQRVIEMLKTSFTTSNASFVVHCQGLTVQQLTALRKQLRQKKSTLHVAKVTLIKRALHEVSDLAEVSNLVSKQVALVFASEESPAVAKVLCDFAKSNEKMTIIGGYFESSVLDAQGVKHIGSLPSREILLAQLCGVLKAPIAKLAFVLQAIADKKNTTQETAPAA
jgi:large subunit ribosomal protein L10